MRRILPARWFWVVVVFAVINILGLLKIVSLLHSPPGFTRNGINSPRIRDSTSPRPWNF